MNEWVDVSVGVLTLLVQNENQARHPLHVHVCAKEYAACVEWSFQLRTIRRLAESWHLLVSISGIEFYYVSTAMLNSITKITFEGYWGIEISVFWNNIIYCVAWTFLWIIIWIKYWDLSIEAFNSEQTSFRRLCVASLYNYDYHSTAKRSVGRKQIWNLYIEKLRKEHGTKEFIPWWSISNRWFWINKSFRILLTSVWCHISFYVGRPRRTIWCDDCMRICSIFVLLFECLSYWKDTKRMFFERIRQWMNDVKCTSCLYERRNLSRRTHRPPSSRGIEQPPTVYFVFSSFSHNLWQSA